MGLAQALHNLGALFVLAIGAAALVRPDRVAGFMALAPTSPFGRSELRSGIGGLWAAMAVFALWSQDALTFAVLGAGFVGATLARWIEIARGEASRDVWVGLFLDAALAGALLYPQAG